MTTYPHHAADLPEAHRVYLGDVGYQAYRLLQFVFVVAPILAGIDKFFHFLVDWDRYLAPWANNVVGGHGGDLMRAFGVVEIIAGIGIAIKPKVFGYVVGIWLCCIIINLLSMGTYFDIALRDLGLALSAFALARLAMFYDRGAAGGLMGRTRPTMEGF